MPIPHATEARSRSTEEFCDVIDDRLVLGGQIVLCGDGNQTLVHNIGDLGKFAGTTDGLYHTLKPCKKRYRRQTLTGYADGLFLFYERILTDIIPHDNQRKGRIYRVSDDLHCLFKSGVLAEHGKVHHLLELLVNRRIGGITADKAFLLATRGKLQPVVGIVDFTFIRNLFFLAPGQQLHFLAVFALFQLELLAPTNGVVQNALENPGLLVSRINHQQLLQLTQRFLILVHVGKGAGTLHVVLDRLCPLSLHVLAYLPGKRLGFLAGLFLLQLDMLVAGVSDLAPQSRQHREILPVDHISQEHLVVFDREKRPVQSIVGKVKLLISEKSGCLGNRVLHHFFDV